MKKQIKRVMKRLLNDKMLSYASNIYIRMKELKYSIVGVKGVLSLNESLVQDHYEFKQKDYHLFFGYYDLQQIKNSRVLFHRVRKDANTKEDKCDIGWIDANTGEIHQIATTRTWCWQQGARLRWSTINSDEVLFNNLHSNKYCTEVWDIDSCECIKRYPVAFYDINNKMTYGLSLNFSRLQRLRPGYGYNTLPDNSIDEQAPNNDGIFLYDMLKGTTELIIPLAKLAEEVSSNDCQHYINHISFSPSGEKFMFFHLWTKGTSNRWSNRLCISDLNGEIVSFDYDEWVVSHYDWKDDETILVTECNLTSGKARYVIYNTQDLKKTIIESPSLNRDGHPTWIGETKFLTDTYPDANRMQYIFISGGSEEDIQLAKVYASPFWTGEKRCDLHPRTTDDNSLICFDCAKNGERSMILLKMKDALREKRIS